MLGIIPVKDADVLGAVRDFLKGLLEARVVEGVYVPLQVDGGAILPALVTDPSRLSQANPLAAVMPINGARAVSALTNQRAGARFGGGRKRLAVVLRSCEVRALIELVKLQQADLTEVIIVSLDCPGTYELVDYVRNREAIEQAVEAYLSAVQGGSLPETEGLAMRSACQICIHPAPEHADIALHLFGADLDRGIPVELDSQLAEALSVQAAEQGLEAGRETTLERVIAGRTEKRQKELAAIQERLQGDGGLAGLFANCIRCHNCMTACPICYCKTCLFRTASFDHPPEHYLLAAQKKGAVRMLGDTLLFHMTRMNHMSASCVSCGMCTSACPADIPVGLIFSAVGERVDAAFGYVPGRDVSEPLPLTTFQANEWTQVGEAVR